MCNMCGIFGYIGKRTDAGTLVLKGLKTLEYRGYDSWGIAIKKQSQISLVKKVGKIGNANINFSKSSLGIGHTRWATHGGVTKPNAHPHFDCTKKIALLHNGIIENYSALKDTLIKEGHKFISQTDTEVIPHLIEKLSKNMSFKDAARLAFKKLTGMNAFVVINTTDDEIIAIKNGSPLVIGIGIDEFFIASDASGIVPYTKNVIFLQDNEMAVLNSKLSILDTNNGKNIAAKIQKLDWEFETAQKGKFKHFLLKEISEQPDIIRSISTRTLEIKKFANPIKKAKGVFMLGCGTASYAALVGTYLFSRIAKMHINFSTGSEFKYLQDYLNKNSLLIPISQSGETIDVVDPVSRAKEKGVKVAAITNVLGSTLYRISDYKILLNAGPEIAVIGTKSYIAMVSLLLLLAHEVKGTGKKGTELLVKAAKNVEEILKPSFQTKIKLVAKKLSKNNHIYILGRGLSYATALEASLKIKETSYVHAEGFAGGELKHGVIALVEKGTPVIVFAPNDETYNEIVSNATETKARGAFIIGIGPIKNSVFDVFLQTADVGDATLIPQVVIIQLLAYYMALAKGLKDPDKPRNLAKSVTVK